MNDAKEALYDIGATGNVHPGFHGSWAFVGYTGPEPIKWAKTVSQQRHKGPAVIEEMIPSPTAEAEISKIYTGPVITNLKTKIKTFARFARKNSSSRCNC